MNAKLRRLLSWEGLLLAIFVLVAAVNANLAPAYLSLNNQINLFQLSIEKIIVALVMTFIIINGEIDLSVASVMGLAACIVAVLFDRGAPMELAIVVALLAGALCGAFNGFWVAYVGLPSLAVTLAGMIGFRGVARILIEDRSIGGFPAWFT
ncbi:ABC transporter permease, partial [Chloroflexus sp.]